MKKVICFFGVIALFAGLVSNVSAADRRDEPPAKMRRREAQDAYIRRIKEVFTETFMKLGTCKDENTKRLLADTGEALVRAIGLEGQLRDQQELLNAQQRRIEDYERRLGNLTASYDKLKEEHQALVAKFIDHSNNK